MDLDNYVAGKLVKHQTGYNYFMPAIVNQEWEWNDPKLNKLVEKAAMKLGELNSFSKLVPNIDLFIQLHVAAEAVDSSKIEGTKTNMGEALQEEDEILPERKNDWQEVQNYISALNSAVAELHNLPISTRLLKHTHHILLQSVRGENKLPGEYRISQNWIGGNSLADAFFVPPHHDYVSELMSDLENFIHNEEFNLPDLVKIAIVHYQFETIHPFLDGNGRIGRLLITLFLIDKQILTKPLLYLSSFFEKNKSLYYDNLTLVRTANNLKQWIKYFLVGLAETAEIATQTLSKIIELKSKLENQIIQNFGKKNNKANLLLQHLFKKPVVTVNQVQAITQLSAKSANELVNDFLKAGILQETTGQKRNRVFIFKDYLNLFSK